MVRFHLKTQTWVRMTLYSIINSATAQSLFWYEYSLIFHYAYNTDTSLLRTERSSCTSLVLKVRVDFRNSPLPDHKALIYPPKFWITIVSNFPSVWSRLKRNRRQWLSIFFGRGEGAGGRGQKSLATLFPSFSLLFFRTITTPAFPPTACSRLHNV